MKYLYLNTIKSIVKRKTFFAGIMILMTIATLMFTLLLNVSDNMKQSYKQYRTTQNIQDFTFYSQADLTKQDILQFYKNYPQVNPKIKARIDAYYQLFGDKTVSPAKLENVREDAMGAMNNLMDVLPYRVKSADQLAKKYHFTYEPSHTKDIVQEVNGQQHAFRLEPYYPDAKISKPYLLNGKFPVQNGEVALLPEYLKANHLKIGATITIGTSNYKIVGTFYDPNAIFPKIDLSAVFFESAKQTLALTTPQDYIAIQNANSESFFIGHFDKEPADITKAVRTIGNDPLSSYMLNYQENLSIGGGLDTMLLAFDSTSYSVLAVFTLISMLVIGFFVRKSILEDRKKLGILKSLGYKTSSIVWSYVVFGVISAISAVIGFVIAIALRPSVLTAIKGYFVLPLLNNSTEWLLLLISIVFLFVMTSGISMFIAYRTLRANPVDLINPTENEGVNRLTRLVVKMTEKSSYQKRFKYTLASRSLSKLMAIITLTTLCGVLITAVFISSNFLSALEKNFANYKYKYEVLYKSSLLQNDPNNGLQPEDKVMIDVKGTIDEINGKETLNNKSSDGEFLHIMGIDENNTSYPIYNMKGKIIHTRSDGIIVTSSFLRQFNAKVGDIVTITPKSKYDFRFQIPIVGLSSNFTDGPGVFMDREMLNTKIGNVPGSYNVRMTSSSVGAVVGTQIGDTIVSSVVSVNETKQNYEKMASIANYIIILLEGFITLLTMTLIALLSNLVIEENASQISLLKVMGFNKKEVDNMVIKIYTPFIILSIVIAIPLALLIAKAIFYSVFGGDNVAFPIHLSVLQVLGSALFVYLGYYLSLKSNRKSLDKIPMAMALKKE
ncbi:MAG TPA: ABC transporter permease [Bacillales bacterium]|nr:ABC transporter permease [Bacillales bacterium]